MAFQFGMKDLLELKAHKCHNEVMNLYAYRKNKKSIISPTITFVPNKRFIFFTDSLFVTFLLCMQFTVEEEIAKR